MGRILFFSIATYVLKYYPSTVEIYRTFFVAQVLINDGPYRGALIHLILRIPDDYPLTGPAGNIAPGLEFDFRYHGHIHEDYRYEKYSLISS